MSSINKCIYSCISAWFHRRSVFIAALSADLTFSHLLFNLLCPAAYRRILSYKYSDNLDSGVSVVEQSQKKCHQA